ncbi:MAG: DUF4230 domain-containing protein [Verrucomicrobiota bacterium]
MFKHYLGLALLLVVAAALVLWGLRTCQAMLNEQVAEVQGLFTQAFNLRPEIRVNQTVVYSQTSPIEELAVVRKEELVEIKIKESRQIWSTDIPMTGKELYVRAIYRFKAGFDLGEPFVVNIDPGTGEVTAELPPAEILSLERVGPLTMKEDAGWLTSINSEDREKLLNQLEATARREAENSGILQEAEEQARQRLQELAERNGQDLAVTVRSRKQSL